MIEPATTSLTEAVILIPLIILAIENNEEREVAIEIWNKYNKKMFSVAMSILKNKEDAEDAVSETVCKIVKNIKYFYGENKKNTDGLIAIYIKYTSINLYNKRKRTNSKVTYLYNDEDELVIDIKDDTTSEDIVLCEESQEIVRDALMKLDEKYRDVLTLRYFHGLKSEEIAQILGITANNVDMRAFRAKQLLSKELEAFRNA